MKLVRRPSDEGGFAMITALIVILVITSLTVVMLATQEHTNTATARNRSWGRAIHVAESGVHQAIAYLQSTNGVVPTGTVSGTTADGQWTYKVTALPRRHYRIDAVGTVGTTTALGATRRVRVEMAPPTSFQYALFSLSDVTTKNNNLVCGDIWANTSVTVYQNDSVLPGTDEDCPNGATGGGSVTAATGWVELQNGSHVAGDIWSGGYTTGGVAVSLGNQAKADGKVKASSSTPACADDLGHSYYKVVNSGTITGSVTTWGTISGSGSTGTQLINTCTSAAASKSMPAFTWNPANYDSATLHQYTFPTDYSTFTNYIAANKNALQGTFKIWGGSASTPIDLTGVSIAGDTTIVTDSPIYANGIGSANSTDKVLVLVSYYSAPPDNCTTTGGNPQDCAIGFKNNFDVNSSSLTDGSNTAVLLYAPNGPIAFKNSADFQGAVYANNIQVKNNMNVIYDPRIDQIVGFGQVTLDIDAWMECRPGAVTTTSC